MKKKKTVRTALIDGDIAIYKAAILTENEGGDALDAEDLVQSIIRTWARSAHCSRIIVTLSCPSHLGFRCEVEPDYKAHRRELEKPRLLKVTRQAVEGSFKCVTQPRLEADDIMGIMATNGKVQNPVIVTIDKDLRQIPGMLFNPDKDEYPRRITELEGRKEFCLQWLAGDSTDNYFGIPKCPAFKRGMGPKTAEKWLDEFEYECPGTFNYEAACIGAYIEAELTLEYCWQQANMARILQAKDYDSKTNTIRLMGPSNPV